MSKKLYPETDIQNIANAIRTLNGSGDTYTVGQMASAIVLPSNAYYLKSASGNPISLTDGEELKCQKAEVDFSPIQDLHGYDNPWVGGAEKNKFDTPTATSTGASNIFNKKSVNLPSGTYTLSFTSASTTTTTMSITFYNGTTSIITGSVTAGNTSVTVTLSSDCDNLTWYVREAVNLSNIQIELGNQKTTFAPYSNECPISGWTEVNLNQSGTNIFDEVYTDITTTNKYRNIYVGKGTYTMSTTAPRFGGGGSCLFFLANQVSGGASTSTNGVWQGQSRTVTSTDGYVTVVYRKDSSVSPENYQTEINVGSSVLPYEPYVDLHTYTEPLGSTYYGGKVDFVSGECVINTEYRLLDGTENWQVANTGTANYYYYIALPSTSYAVNASIIADKFPQGNITNSNTDFGIIHCTAGYIRIRPFDTEISVDDWKTWLYSNNIQVVFELQNPTELTLTPQEIELLKGQNVLSTNGDNIQLKYWSKSLN